MYQRIFGTISLPLVLPMIRWRAASMDLAMDVPLEPLIVPMTVWGLGLCNTVMFPVYSWSFAMNHWIKSSDFMGCHWVIEQWADFPTRGIPPGCLTCWHLMTSFPCHALIPWFLQVPWLWEGGPRSIIPRTWCSITIWAARQEISGLTYGWNHLKPIESLWLRPLGPRRAQKIGDQRIPVEMQQPGWQADPSRSVERSAGKLKYDLEIPWGTHNGLFGGDYVHIRRHYAKGC